MAALIPNVRFEIVDGGHGEGTGNTPQVRARIIAFFDEDSRESGNRFRRPTWMPAFAGMTVADETFGQSRT